MAIFELPELPYAKHALEPYISQETLEYHHGKHHLTYINKLNGLIAGTQWAESSLEDIVMGKANTGIFNNAAQAWNHSFYWNSLCPPAQHEEQPSGRLAAAIARDFGSLDAFKERFTEAALTQFGSGWAWLVQDPAGKLVVMKTSNAGNPMTDGYQPLLTCDVWEHAYYIDTRNDRAQYLKHFWKLAHWAFAASNMTE